MAALPGEGRPLSGIEGVSELFDRVVLTRQAEDALLVQAVLLDELHALLHQDGNHAGAEALLVGHRVHQTLRKHCGEASQTLRATKVKDQMTRTGLLQGIMSLVCSWCVFHFTVSAAEDEKGKFALWVKISILDFIL